MSKYHTSIAQWGLVSGIRQDASDLVIIHDPPSRFSPQARKGQLLLVTEAAGDATRSREACMLVARTIHDTFYDGSSGSITSSLRKAMQAANAALYQYNFEAPPHKRSTVGVSSVVLHGTDLYLAQVPPTQAFVAHAGRLRALPQPLAWANGVGGSPVGTPTTGPLGTSLGSEPEFFRSLIQPGDTLVLCSTNVARLLSKPQAEELFCFADATTIADGLYALCRRASLPEAHVAALESMPALSAEAQQSPISVAGVSERGKLAAGAVGDWLGGVAAEAQRASTGRAQSKATNEAPQPVVAQATVPATMTAANAQVGAALLERVPVGDAEPLPPSAFLGEGEYGGIVRPPTPKRPQRIDLGDNTGMPIDFGALPRRATPPPASRRERATLPLRRVLVGALGGLANRRRHSVRPVAEVHKQPPKVRGLSYRRTRRPFPWLQLGLIGVVLALLVIGGLQANRNHDTTTVRQAIQNVDGAIRAARVAPDNATAQNQLQLAGANLKKIEPLIASGLITTTKATWAPYQRLLSDYDSAMAEINHIGLFDSFTTVASLPDPKAVVSRVVLSAGNPAATTPYTPTLYLLDDLSGAVYQQEKNQLRAILKPGDTVGEGKVTNKLRELLWRDGAPVTFERDDSQYNAFVTVYLRDDKGGWFSVRLQGTELVPNPKIMPPVATFSGNLYLWNAKAEALFGAGVATQLMRYEAGHYADLPASWIQDTQAFKDVVSVAVDGKVYLLHTDASIDVFEGGRWQQKLVPPELAVPLVNAQRFVVTPDVVDQAGTVTRPGSIYLFDTQNERVVQITKDKGQLIQQMQARARGPLNQVKDLQVDEANGFVYLANGNRVLRATLPQPAGASRATATPEASTTATP